MIARLKTVCTWMKGIIDDSAYAWAGLPKWVRTNIGWTLPNLLRPVRASGFGVLPTRWILERTFVWINNYRHRRD